MTHDLLAELNGYKAELDLYERRGQDERAGAVRDEIKRVEDAVRERAEKLEDTADKHDKDGQDVRAAEARVEARRYREALPAGDAAPASEAATQDKPPAKQATGRPPKENTADKTPKEKA